MVSFACLGSNLSFAVIKKSVFMTRRRGRKVRLLFTEALSLPEKWMPTRYQYKQISQGPQNHPTKQPEI